MDSIESRNDLLGEVVDHVAASATYSVPQPSYLNADFLVSRTTSGFLATPHLKSVDSSC